MVQRLSQELLVDATEVGDLLLALMVHIHATVWGEGEAGPSGSCPGRAASRPSQRQGGEDGREEGFGGGCWVSRLQRKMYLKPLQIFHYLKKTK